MDQFKADVKQNDSGTDLNLLRMLESRIVEVIQIEKEVKKKYPKLFTQRLPRYMRRRAASHNPNRIPKWLKNFTSKRSQDKMTARDRSKLYKYRMRLRHAKHKRILKRHSQHKYKDPNKCLLHKWFAKRFKMVQKEEDLTWVPLHNNTKNFRNLYRQTLFGCAYFSLAHLISFQVDANLTSVETLKTLNSFCRSTSGFTFAARALQKGRYELVIHLYKAQSKERTTQDRQLDYVCPAFVSANTVKHTLTMWVPRLYAAEVEAILKESQLTHKRLWARDTMRLRLVGPNASDEAEKIAERKVNHQEALYDVERRLLSSRKFGLTIGRHLEEKSASFTYFQTNPPTVDVVLRDKKLGRQLWHKLIKNKAHLVGGKRDVEELFKDNECFRLRPDCVS